MTFSVCFGSSLHKHFFHFSSYLSFFFLLLAGHDIIFFPFSFCNHSNLFPYNPFENFVKKEKTKLFSLNGIKIPAALVLLAAVYILRLRYSVCKQHSKKTLNDTKKPTDSSLNGHSKKIPAVAYISSRTYVRLKMTYVHLNVHLFLTRI